MSTWRRPQDRAPALPRRPESGGWGALSARCLGHRSTPRSRLLPCTMARTYRHRRTVPHGRFLPDGQYWLRVRGGGVGDDTAPGYRPMRKETRQTRRHLWRQYRTRARQAMQRERWEDVPRWRGTCGWHSW